MQRKWRRYWQRSSREERCGSPMKTAAKYLFPPLIAAGIMLGSMGMAHAGNPVLPTGGVIVNGDGTITVDGRTMNINQYTNKMIADWTTFSIGNGETVNFIQPGKSSIALNRVLGNEASNIYGNLNANGQVFLINPNGVLFSSTARVDTGSFVASTLDIDNDDFISGSYTFTNNGGGAIENQGTITAADGGYVALLGADVKNGGRIVARKGTVALAAGNAVTLDMNDDNLLNIAVNQAADNASVENQGCILADGGLVVMTAQAANALTRNVVNNSGLIQAQSIDNKNGVIRLDGGASGAVVNSGTLDASGRDAGQKGGKVTVLGDTIKLDNGSKVDVAGDRGGGTALIGGNYQGKGVEQNATTTYVDTNATINADAIHTGNGGTVVVWADDKTVFNGTISARGGANGGDGGEVETSGRNSLKVGASVRVTTLADKGKAGNWLLDPADFTIAASGGDMTGATLSDNLNLGNVTILSSEGTVNPDGNGDINLNDSLTWNGYTQLTLSAYRDVNINADITAGIEEDGWVIGGYGNLIIEADNTRQGRNVLGKDHGQVFFDPNSRVKMNGGTVDITSDGFTIAPSGGNLTGASLYDMIKTADIKITTVAPNNSPADLGDINLNDAVSRSSGIDYTNIWHSLTLSAYRDVNIGASGRIDWYGQYFTTLKLQADNTGQGRIVLGNDHGQVYFDPNSKVRVTYGTVDITSDGFTVAASGGNLTGALLSYMLGEGNVAITTVAPNNSPAAFSDINLNDAISWSNKGRYLTLSAYRDVNINADIAGGSDSARSEGLLPTLTLRADNTGQGQTVLGPGHGMVNFDRAATVNMNGGTVDITSDGFTVAASDGNITGASLGTMLDNANVLITVPTGDSGTAGDISVNDAVSYASKYNLTLSAYRDVNINADITDRYSNSFYLPTLTLRADNTGQGQTVLGPGHGMVNFDRAATVNMNGGTMDITSDSFSIGGADAPGVVSGAYLATMLNNGNVLITVPTGDSGTTGDISVNDAVSYASKYNLTLSAYRDVNINADITGGGGTLKLTANSGWGGGQVYFNKAATVNMNGGTVDITSDSFGIGGANAPGMVSGAYLGTMLNNGNVLINVSTGDISVDDAVRYTSGNNLTLSAYGDVNINADITGDGALTLTANNGWGGGQVYFEPNATVKMSGGSVAINSDGFTVESAGNRLTVARLAAMLNDSDVSVTATNGDLTVSDPDPVRWDSSHTLNLAASVGNLSIDAPIIAPRGGLTVGLPYSGTISCPVAIDVGAFTNNGYWLQNAAVLPSFRAVDFINNATFRRVTGGDGSSGDPFQITDSYGLQGVGKGRYEWSNSNTDYFILVSDIDLSDAKVWNNGQGFVPIQNFAGGFDGDGHTISNLYINTDLNPHNNYIKWDASGIGLFAMIDGGYGGGVHDLNLTNVDITGKGVSAVGGLAGLDYSAAIENVYVTGKVTGVDVGAVGGLVGKVDEQRVGDVAGDPFPYSVVNSGSAAAVTATGSSGQIAAGGLIGQFDYHGQPVAGFVRNSYSSGPVTIAGDYSTIYAGGLVGLNQGGSIDQTYSTGAVTVNNHPQATVHAGGLVGASTDYEDWSGETIANSYSTGKVSLKYSGDKTYVGGFAGSNSGDITGSYYAADASGQAKGIGAGKAASGLTPLASAEMVQKQKFAGWDFDNTWFILDNYTMPFLRSEWSARINNTHQLQLMAMDPTAAYTLAADIDLRGYNMAPGVGFVPIANFTGSLDGQGHTVSYLNIHDYSGGDAVGLFAHLGRDAAAGQSAYVHDIALANATVSGTATNPYAGILAGLNDGGSIANVFTGGSVSGSGSVGGIAGQNTGTIAASFSAAKVTGPASMAGGLAGDNSGTVSESYLDDAGSVNGVDGSNGAPLIGAGAPAAAPGYSDDYWVSRGGNHYLKWTVAPDGTIGLYTPSQLQAIQNYLSGSYALRADIDLAGRNWTAIGARDSAFTGTLDGIGYGIDHLTIAGSTLEAVGLFGYTRGATLSNLTLTNVSVAGVGGNQYVGGLVGYSDGGSITASSVDGTVTASREGSPEGGYTYVGGLAGYNNARIAFAGNAAAVTAAGAGSSAGGIAGASDAGGSIALSSNTGAVTVRGQDSYAGGLTGQNAGSIVSSFNTGAVTAKSAGSAAGGIAGSNAGHIGSSTAAVYNTGAVTTEGDNSYAGGIAGRNTGRIGVDTYAPYAPYDPLYEIPPEYKDTPGRVDASNGFYTDYPGQGIVYNTGNVTALGAGSSVGGIAGQNNGEIIQAYTAAIVAARGNSSSVGGIVGVNSGSIVSSFFGAAVSGDVARLDSVGADSSVGGIAGVNSDSGSIADTMSYAWLNSTGPDSYVGGLVGDNRGSLVTSYALGAVQGAGANSKVGGLIGNNAPGAGATVANLVWNEASTGQKQGVGSGLATGTALNYDEMLDSANWSAFTTNWMVEQGQSGERVIGLFPRLSWQPKYMFFGRVVNAGPGVTVNKYDGDSSYTTTTFGADGLYFMTAGGSKYNGSNDSLKSVLLTVSGQPYKANAIYEVGLNPAQNSLEVLGATPPDYVPPFYDLQPGTLVVGNPAKVTSNMTGYDGVTINQLIGSAAVTKRLAAKDPDLMFTLSLSEVVQGNPREPSQSYHDVFLYALNVAGNFVGRDLVWYKNNWPDFTATSITAHKTDYANGDITLDNSQTSTQIMLWAQGQAVRFVADGNIDITEAGNVVLGASIGADNNGPRLQAGGDITINCGGYFLNWAGADAIQAGGRYLIYANDMILPSYGGIKNDSVYDNSFLFFDTRYIDSSYTTAIKLDYANEQLLYDMRGGLSGFVLWGYQEGDAVPASGNGFIYTAHDPHTDTGIQERFWMTPAYFATQQRRQMAADAAQAGLGAASLPAPETVADAGDLSLTIVDGGVALPPAEGK